MLSSKLVCQVRSRHVPAAGQSAFQLWEDVLHSEGCGKPLCMFFVFFGGERGGLAEVVLFLCLCLLLFAAVIKLED